MLRGDNIVLLGHDCDSSIILEQATAKNAAPALSAYIVLNPNINIEHIGQIQSPLLDIRSSNRTTDDQNNSNWLKMLEKSGGRQMELPMTSDNFSAQEDSVIFLISNWLRKL